MRTEGLPAIRVRICSWLLLAVLSAWAGCADRTPKPDPRALMGEVPDVRTPISLPAEVGRAHRDVMMQHLETIQVLVGALADGDYELARGVTEAHVGFFARRHAATEYAPPAYVERAVAHVQAAKDLAAVLPSQDMKQILPRLNGLLKTCMACHLDYKVGDSLPR